MKNKLDKIPPIAEAKLLSIPELARLARSSKHLHGLFLPLLKARKEEHVAVTRLLYQVVRGKHEAVRALLKENIDLLYKRGSITDCSGRKFESISPFEYALWALDSHMWNTMLKCVLENAQGDEVLKQLAVQYKTLQTYRVTYILNETLITESHFNFQQTIIKELQIQVDAANASGDKDWGAIDKQWRKGVGGAQRLLPMHVVNEYCAAEWSFHPIPDFTTYPGSSEQFDNWVTDQEENWFDVDSRLGIDFGIVKDRPPFGAMGGASPFLGRVFQSSHADACADLAAMLALCKVRTNDFTNLATLLGVAPDSQPLNTCNRRCLP